MGVKEDIIVEIGQILMRNAQKGGAEWDYCGYMFETQDGASSGGEMFMFHNGNRLPFRLGRDMKDITTAFKRFREVTRVEGDDYWLKCLAVLRRDGDFKMLFEFDDWSRWSITPANVDQAYAMLVGEIYPEALED